MFTLFVVVHVIVSVLLVAIVLLQVGRGRGMLGFLGGGTAEALFGSRAGDVLTRSTTAIAAIFMITSLSLAYISLHKTGSIAGKIKSRPASNGGEMTETTAGESNMVTAAGADAVNKAKDKILNVLGGKKDGLSGVQPKETTKSELKYDQKGNKTAIETKYDAAGKAIGKKEVVYDKTDKVVSEKELPLEEVTQESK